ncbi:MAG: hemolysin family protein [Treponema sp.]|nr:hemolysin family protein [Treponema sp.]
MFFLFIAVILIGRGFLSFIESGLRSGRKIRLTFMAEDGDKRFRRALKIVEKPELFISAFKTAGAFLDVLGGVFFGLSVAFHISPQAFLWERRLIIAGFALGFCLVSFLINGIVRQIALFSSEKLIARFLFFIQTLALLHKPLWTAVQLLSRIVEKLVQSPESSRESARETASQGMAELRAALQAGERSGAVESAERTMVEGVFYLGDRPAVAFMTHRSEIAWLDIDADADEIKNTVWESRTDPQRQYYLPVADGTLDNIVGVVSVEDVLSSMAHGKQPVLKTLMKTPHFVPETMSALKVFEVFKQVKDDFLLVMDEYGGLSGILSLRDLVEEIVGQLAASPQTEEVVKQEDGVYLVDGSVSIDEIAELLSMLSLVDEHQEYHTLAGFILRLAGEIPCAGQSFIYKGIHFKVLDMDGNRIDKVEIRKSNNSPDLKSTALYDAIDTVEE